MDEEGRPRAGGGLPWPLGAATDPALPVEGWTTVDLPVERVWETFCDVAGWPSWNPCFRWSRVTGGRLRVGATLYWVFNPIKRWYPYLLPAVARVVAVEPLREVTWQVGLPGFSALHSYRFDAVDGQRCRFGSWEVAGGPAYRRLRRFWLAHFRYVCDASLAGARTLARRRAPGVRLVPYGAPTGEPPLVCVPGIDGSAGSVAPIIERLAADRQVWLVDYSAEANPTLEALTDEVAATVLGRLAGPVDLLGQSIGTIVAAQLAARPDLAVRRVVLVGTFTRGRWGALAAGALAMRLTPRRLYRATAGPLMALACGPVGDGRDHPFLTRSGDSDPAAVSRRTRWQVRRDFSTDLAAVEQPTLVLMGASDRFVPNAAREVDTLRTVLAARPTTVTPIPRAGHVLLPSAAIETAAATAGRFLTQPLAGS